MRNRINISKTFVDYKNVLYSESSKETNRIHLMNIMLEEETRNVFGVCDFGMVLLLSAVLDKFELVHIATE